ncbi:MAG: urea ABC transporter ATP-binding protein UrtD [Treponema sp.]
MEEQVIHKENSTGYEVPPVISIENISVEFDGFKALNNVTTKIMPNEVHFFIGPNGAGKTTLLDIICGKTKPSAGKVIYHGGEDFGNREDVNLDLTKMREFDIVNAGIGRKFQTPSVYESLTVWQNMELSLKSDKTVTASLFFKSTKKQQDRIEHMLSVVGLLEKRYENAAGLSHGQKQWLEIAMLLVQEPQVLMLDEPVAGMGKQETDKTGSIIKAIAKQYAVVVVEHDMAFVRQTADMVTVMHEGKILIEGTAEKVLSDDKVKAVYLGRGKFHKSGE